MKRAADVFILVRKVNNMALKPSENDTSSPENSDNDQESLVKLKKTSQKEKRGIVFLSTIPKFMNVTKVREIFGQYGEIDRVFLQPEEQKGEKRKKKPSKHFTEGWIEFKKKRIAKQVAALLNNKQIGGRKRSKFYDFIWNIKYLPRFKWVHLSERLAYERAVHKQRMNTEIAQAKREANFFSQNVELKERLAKKKSKEVQEDSDREDSHETKKDDLMHLFPQRDLDSEIQEKKLKTLHAGSIDLKKRKKASHKKKLTLDTGNREDFLKSVFGSRT